MFNKKPKHRKNDNSKTKLAFTVAVLSLIILIPAALLFLSGYRAFVVTTPSMGEYAPVGTLVLSQPVNYDDIASGDTLLFKQPQNPSSIYFHRVLERDSDGISTQGDINDSKDPWKLTANDVIGKELIHIFGLGWFFKMLPYYVVGGIILHVLVRYYMPGYWKFPALVSGYQILTSIGLLIVQPLVQTRLLAQASTETGGEMKFVTTGILTLKTQAVGGTSVTLDPGQVGVVTTDVLGEDGYYHASFIPAPTLLQIILILSICLLPVILNLTYAIIARRKGWDLIEVVTEEKIGNKALTTAN